MPGEPDIVGTKFLRAARISIYLYSPVPGSSAIGGLLSTPSGSIEPAFSVEKQGAKLGCFA